MKELQDATQDCPGGPLLSGLTLIGVRMALALALLTLFQPRLTFGATWREHGVGAAVGLVFALGFVPQVWGLGSINPALSAFFTSLASVWVPLIAFAVFRTP